MNNNNGKGEMSVQDAGKKGGKIGGRRTAETHGHDFYRDIGQKGGQKVKKLIEAGKQAEAQDSMSDW